MYLDMYLIMYLCLFLCLCVSEWRWQACGAEHAVAATKSTVEQALAALALLEAVVGDAQLGARQAALADGMARALASTVDDALVARVARAPALYWAGPSDGVAAELTLKTHEILRKPAQYLEGTYAVHGVEEVMSDGDVLVWLDPPAEFEEKFERTLAPIGVHIVAVATRDTRFPTIRIDDCGDLTPLVALAAGWRLLALTGVHAGIDIDKPLRARKVGNEFEGDAAKK